MEKLSAKLRSKIQARPLNTLLISSSPEIAKKYKQVRAPVEIIREFPKEFNGPEVWKDLLLPVHDQGNCGSCWAFAAVGCLADKMSIQTEGKLKVRLSPAKVILCDWQGKEFTYDHPEQKVLQNTKINKLASKNAACTGNSLLDAWRYLYLLGTSSEDCVPYSLDPGQAFGSLKEYKDPNKLPSCMDVCGIFGDLCLNFKHDLDKDIWVGDPMLHYRAFTYYTLAGTEKQGGSSENIMQNIYNWGPVTTGIKIYPDFYEFDPVKEIYEWNGKGPQVGGHAIELVGWGEEDGKKFWWVKNSWGADWGLNGYFKMVRGLNNCQIEENVVGGAPDFWYPAGYQVPRVVEQERINIPKDVKLQGNKLDYGILANAGGIDPTTGYSRRVMSLYPGYDYSAPYDYHDLPDINTFIAGKVTGRRSWWWIVIFLFFFVLILILVISKWFVPHVSLSPLQS